jgi:RNA polymerase sigma-70 factor (ECF subfamily)
MAEPEERMAASQPDEMLMALVAQRDQRAFSVLMERHMARAIRFAERIVGNAEADDIAQEAFVRVWNRGASYDPGVGRFTTWLYRIVLNLAIDSRRRPRHLDIEEAADVPSNEPEPVVRLIADEQDRSIAAAMAALPERQRAAIALFHMEGLSVREAALAMNLSEKAFESLLTRARSALKQEVEKAYIKTGR